MKNKKQQLFIRKENGRYEPYVEPEVSYDDNVLYKKMGKRYVPHNILLPRDFLNEGVWVVSKHRSGYGVTSASYLRELFQCERVSDLKNVSVAELGGIDKLADHLQQHWGDIDRTLSIADQCRQIVGILFNYGKEGEK